MSRRTVVSVLALGLVVPASLVAGPAQACACHFTDISVRVSDPTPASGQTFRIRGRFFDSGSPAQSRIVKVQTRRDDRWVRIRGARVRTNDEGRYRMRLVLSQRGRRMMRVVGVDRGEGPNAYERFRVRVH